MNRTNAITIEVEPSARAMTLEWFSLGPEYIASIFSGKVIQGVGFASTEVEAVLEAKRDAKETFGFVCP